MLQFFIHSSCQSSTKVDMTTQTDITGEEEVRLQQIEKEIRRQRIQEKNALKREMEEKLKEERRKTYLKELQDSSFSFDF